MSHELLRHGSTKAPKIRVPRGPFGGVCQSPAPADGLSALPAIPVPGIPGLARRRAALRRARSVRGRRDRRARRGWPSGVARDRRRREARHGRPRARGVGLTGRRGGGGGHLYDVPSAGSVASACPPRRRRHSVHRLVQFHSTPLAPRRGEDGGREARLDLLRGVMQRHGGQEIKSLGDGLVIGAVPRRRLHSEDAAPWPRAARPQAWGSPERRGSRPGPTPTSTGCPVVVREAALRLRRTRADPGSQPDPRAGRRGSGGPRSSGRSAPLRLKGVADPLQAYAIERVRRASQRACCPHFLRPLACVSRARPAGGTRRAPGAAARRAGLRCDGARVGWSPSKESRAWAEARLVAEFAAERASTGSVVLLGRSEEQPLEAYQPFVEALASCLGRAARAPVPPQAWLRCCPARAPMPPTARSNAGARRQALFDIDADVPGRSRPGRGRRTLVLDDLQWANAASLLLLRWSRALRRRAAARGRQPTTRAS